MTSSNITINLTEGERQTLLDLLNTFIQHRVCEAVQVARISTEMDKAAERVRRLAQLHDLAAEGNLPRADAEVQRADLMLWAMETTSTIEEAAESIAEADERDDRSSAESIEAIASARRQIVVDYAHAMVCEKIVSQIDAARERVAV